MHPGVAYCSNEGLVVKRSGGNGWAEELVMECFVSFSLGAFLTVQFRYFFCDRVEAIIGKDLKNI